MGEGCRSVKLLKLAKVLAPAVLLAGLGGCKSFDSRPNVGPCPAAGALYDASRLVEVGQPERHENVAYTGEIEGVHGFCRYVAKDPITMEVDIDFAFGRGPKAEGDSKTYNYL